MLKEAFEASLVIWNQNHCAFIPIQSLCSKLILYEGAAHTLNHSGAHFQIFVMLRAPIASHRRNVVLSLIADLHICEPHTSSVRSLDTHRREREREIGKPWTRVCGHNHTIYTGGHRSRNVLSRLKRSYYNQTFKGSISISLNIMKGDLNDHIWICTLQLFIKKWWQNEGRCPLAYIRKCMSVRGDSRDVGRLIINHTYRAQPFLWAGQRQISQTGCCWPKGQRGSGFSWGWRQKGRQQVGSWSCDPPAVPCWQPWRQSTPSCWVEVVALRTPGKSP